MQGFHFMLQTTFDYGDICTDKIIVHHCTWKACILANMEVYRFFLFFFFPLFVTPTWEMEMFGRSLF